MYALLVLLPLPPRLRSSLHSVYLLPIPCCWCAVHGGANLVVVCLLVVVVSPGVSGQLGACAAGVAARPTGGLP